MGVNEKLEFSTSPDQVRPSKTKTMDFYTILSQALKRGRGIFLKKYQSEGGSPERLIPSLGVESGLAGRIFVLFVGLGPCFE